MFDDPLLVRRASAALLLLSFALMLIGILLFWIRMGAESTTATYKFWERGTITAGTVVAALGFALLEANLSRDAVSVFARIGIVLIVIGAVFNLLAESDTISGSGWVYARIVIYVVLTLLGQAAFGAAVLRSGLLSNGVGWFTILWNLAWLVILPILTSKDVYYPVLHMIAPLVIGIALLL